MAIEFFVFSVRDTEGFLVRGPLWLCVRMSNCRCHAAPYGCPLPRRFGIALHPASRRGVETSQEYVTTF